MGGPYNACDEIEGEYGGVASQKLIDEVVEELNDISWDWSGQPDGCDDYYDDRDD